MFDDVKAFYKPKPVRPIAVNPSVVGRLNKTTIAEIAAKCLTWEEFLLDPYVNPHYRGFCYVNSGLVDPESTFRAWVRSMCCIAHFPGERLKDDDILEGVC